MMTNPSESKNKDYQEVKRGAKKVCRKKKRNHIDNKLSLIEDHYVNKEIRNFYQECKKSRKTYVPLPQYIKDKEGSLMADKAAKLTRWKEYFAELLSENDVLESELEWEETEHTRRMDSGSSN
ncbi:hypothetical protein QE152_g5821 [Popillia japonica]|uniref:Uncharacterized protein n=1 Tax=Popillia japonica TaxID=7064 RepID=A0AAW1MGZ6_POPJA